MTAVRKHQLEGAPGTISGCTQRLAAHCICASMRRTAAGAGQMAIPPHLSAGPVIKSIESSASSTQGIMSAPRTPAAERISWHGARKSAARGSPRILAKTGARILASGAHRKVHPAGSLLGWRLHYGDLGRLTRPLTLPNPSQPLPTPPNTTQRPLTSRMLTPG